MDIRVLLFFIIIFSGLLNSTKYYFLDEDEKFEIRKNYVFIVSLILVFHSALRGLSVGNDTYLYYVEFNNVRNDTWTQVLDGFIDAIHGYEKDPGFHVIIKAFQTFSSSFRFFLFLAAFWFFLPLGKILLRTSDDLYHLVFAYVLFVALFDIVVLSGIRQQIATGFVFWSFLALLDNKHVLACLFIIIGATIHISAIIFILLIPFHFLNEKLKLLHLATILVIPIVIAFGGPISLYLASFSPNEYYSGYGEHAADMGALTYVLCMTATSILTFVFLNKDFILESSQNKYLYATLPLATFFAPLIMQGPSLIRLGQYFTLFFMVLIPKAIDEMAQDTYRNSLYVISITFLLFLSLKSDFFYCFWFNDPQLFLIR